MNSPPKNTTRPSARPNSVSASVGSAVTKDTVASRRLPHELGRSANSARAVRSTSPTEQRHTGNYTASMSSASLNSTWTGSDYGRLSRPQTQMSTRPVTPAEYRDISFLGDKPGHGRLASRREFTDGSIPQSMIPAEHHVIERSTMPPTTDDYKYEYDDKDRLWKVTVFPGLKPSSRKEVVLLDKWLNEQLENTLSKNKSPIDIVHEAQHLYSTSFNEIVRQVSVHCMERGKLLAKIWNRYLQLFDIVMELRAQEKDQFIERLRVCEGSIQNIKMESENSLLNYQLEAQSERRILIHQQQRLEQQLEKLTLQLEQKTESERQLKMKLKSLVSWIKSKKANRDWGNTRSSQDDLFDEDSLLLNSEDDDKESAEGSPTVRVSSLAIKARRASVVTVPGSASVMSPKLSSIDSKPRLGSATKRGSSSNSMPGANRRQQSLAKLNALSSTHDLRDLDLGKQLNAVQSVVGGVLVPECWMKYVRTIPKEGYQANVKSEYWMNTFINFIYHYIADDISSYYQRPTRNSSNSMRRSSKLKHSNSDLKEIANDTKPFMKEQRMEIHDIIYDYFLQLYGLRTIAEMHLLDLLHTVSTMATSLSERPKIYLFSRFLGLNESLPRDAIDYYIYASCVLSVPYSRTTRPGTSEIAPPFAFNSDEMCPVPLSAAKETMTHLLDFMDQEAQITFLSSLQEMAPDKLKMKREISAQMLLSAIVDKWVEKSYESLLIFLKSARTGQDDQVNLDSFIVAMQRFDSSKSRFDIISLYREILVESQNQGDDFLDEAIETVFRRHGLIKEPKVGSVPEMIKDEDKLRLRSAEYHFLADNWAASSSDLELYTKALYQNSIIPEQVRNEIFEQIRFISKLITTQAEPALIISSHRMLLIRIFSFPRIAL